MAENIKFIRVVGRLFIAMIKILLRRLFFEILSHIYKFFITI